MKRNAVAALVAGALVWALPAESQVFGQFTGAEPLPVNGRLFGAYLQSSESVVGLLGQLRLSFYPNVDFGFQGGLSRIDQPGGDVTTVRLGGDVKIGVMAPTDVRPYAISVGGSIGVEAGDDFSILTVVPSVVVSRTFQSDGTSMTPYARAGLSIARLDVGPLDDNEVSLPLRFGGDFRFGRQLGACVELQLQLADSFNDNVGLAAGVNIPF